MLIKNLKNLGFVLLAFFAITLTSCETEDTTLVDSENFVDPTIIGMQAGAIGKNACLEFIFPITISFVDETSAQVGSYDELKESITNWFENTDAERNRENKPQLEFPIQVVNQDGETIDVASKAELFELKRECGGRFIKPNGRKGGRKFHCFSLVFPISAVIGEETQSFADTESFRAAIKAYKQENGRDAERPALVFPITVEDEDGAQTEVASKEDLETLKATCAD